MGKYGSKKYNSNVQRLKSVEERFWEKVNKNGSIPKHCPELGNCWEWMASRAFGGRYGSFSVGNRKRKSSHRFSWEIHNGKIPINLLVLHKCDNPICVRPDHLFLGSDSENAKDMIKKGRKFLMIGDRNWLRKNAILRSGEKNPVHKLTEKDVLKIENLKRDGFSQTKIAMMFDVNQSQISRIIHKKRWKYFER